VVAVRVFFTAVTALSFGFDTFQLLTLLLAFTVPKFNHLARIAIGIFLA
jgi:hypothetical protein